MLSQKVLNRLPAFHFRITVYTNTTPTVINTLARTCFKNHRSAITIMVIKFELSYSVSTKSPRQQVFGQKSEMLKL